MLVVGLTGGIATGKSTVSKRLREKYNLAVVDADVLAREAVAPGTSAYNAIIDYFGGITPHLVADDGSGELNRAALGRTVFGNDKYRKMLNSIVHPAVRKAMAWAVLRHWLLGYAVLVLDVPLLFESQLDKYVGLAVAVLCSEERQYARLRQRDPQLSESDARERIASQMSLATKRQRADYVVENDGSLEDLYTHVDELVKSQLSPSRIRTDLQWFPPIGGVWAMLVYYFRSKL